MGAVWAARHTVTNKSVALKVLLERGGDDAGVRERLLREAKAVCAIKHPNVVPVHDVLELDGGAPALVMDLLEGESLAGRLERTTRLPHPEVVEIAIQILSALEAAHALGIIHRDLKPDNVFLAKSALGREEVRVLDFGIAKVTKLGEDDKEAAALTRTDAMLGTPYYMAPEQVFGEKDIDARSDVWAMGILMYECLAGVKPTEGNNLGQIFKIITVGPMEPLAAKAPNAPASLVKVVTQCLERDRTGRFASATALREALEKVKAGGTMDNASVAMDARPTREEAAALSGQGAPKKSAVAKWVVGIAASIALVGAIGGTAVVMKQRAAHAVPTADPAVATTAPPVAVDPASAPASASASASASAPASASASASASPLASASAPASGKGKKPGGKPGVAAKAEPAAPAAPKDERAAGKVVVTPPF